MSKVLELCAGKLQYQVLRSGRISGNKRKIDLSLGHAGELDLRLFRRLIEALKRLAVVSQVDAGVLSEFFGDLIHNAFVEIIAAKMRIPRCGPDFGYSVSDVEDRYIEGARHPDRTP